MLNKNIPSHSR